MTARIKLYIAFIFFWGMGIICLYFAADIFLTGTGPRGQDLLMDHHSNPLLKYAIAFISVGFAIPCIASPILLYKGILVSDYYNAPTHLKAKHNVILGALLFPACIILSATFYSEGCNGGLDCKTGALAGALFVGFFSYNIFNLIKNRDKFSHNKSLENNVNR